MNKTLLVGRLGQNVQYTKLESGKEVAKLRIATSEGYGDQKITEWHDVECWEFLARQCHEQLKKGDRVAVEGSIRTSTWVEMHPEHGEITHINRRIVAKHIEFLFEKKKKDEL